MEAYQIKTPEDWWGLVDRYQRELLLTIAMSETDHPVRIRKEGNTTKLTAEFDDPRTAQTLSEQFLKGIENGDWKQIRSVLDAVFFKAPDSRRALERPAWDLLCDLCSETWVFTRTATLVE